jgi:hypothetical protein
MVRPISKFVKPRGTLNISVSDVTWRPGVYRIVDRPRTTGRVSCYSRLVPCSFGSSSGISRVRPAILRANSRTSQ